MENISIKLENISCIRIIWLRKQNLMLGIY